jgi:hypothetical protein
VGLVDLVLPAVVGVLAAAVVCTFMKEPTF